MWLRAMHLRFLRYPSGDDSEYGLSLPDFRTLPYTGSLSLPSGTLNIRNTKEMELHMQKEQK